MMLNYPVRRLVNLWMAHEGLPYNPRLVSLTTGRAVFADLICGFTQGHNERDNWQRAHFFREQVMRRYHEMVAQQLITVVQDFKIEVTDDFRMIITYHQLWRPHDLLTMDVPLRPLTKAQQHDFEAQTEKALRDAEAWMWEQPPVRLA